VKRKKLWLLWFKNKTVVESGVGKTEEVFIFIWGTKMPMQALK